LADTYGVLLYQEQMMRIACEVGGYTAGEADRLRREMGRRSPSLEAYHRPRFTAGAAERGLAPKEAEELFAQLCRFAGYSFNKAHSAAYALVTYWTAYLKTHFPVEFYAALLTVGFGYYGPSVYVHEARMKGISILPPHVNHSTLRFTPEGDGIRAALHLVHDLGGRGVETLLAARQKGEFSSLQDFCHRVGRSALRRSAIVNLIKAGSFDGLGLNRRQALACLDDILKGTHRQPGQMSLLDLLSEEVPIPDLPEFTAEDSIAAEASVLGMPLSAHPLAPYHARLQNCGRVPLAHLPSLPPDTDVTVAAVTVARSRRRLKQGGVMLTLFISDESGFAEAVLFPAVYKRLLYRLKVAALLLKGKTTADGDAMIVTDAVPLSMLRTMGGEEKGMPVSN
ncbi:MAG: DNA polymerase III subunit alpha, partial [Bacillota bacterium]|nr:DNA polymerase III subunit alpha [Bacillota bacterium]